MTKVYPRVNIATSKNDDNVDAKNPTMLTVWKKSLLFNCDGFTVFDAQGNLVYRVDNYMSGCRNIVLMDASGSSLFTIRRKKQRLGANSRWFVFKGEAIDEPMYSVTKSTQNFLSRNKCVAHVSSISTTSHDERHAYEIAGSFCQRCCGVYDNKGGKVAEIKQKEAPVRGVALGMDIFTLVVQPGLIDTPLAMAFVILLDQMFRSSSTSRRLSRN